MLMKLMKYDLKSLIKTMLPCYLIIIGIALLQRITGVLADNIEVINIVHVLLSIVFILSLIALPFIAYIMSGIRYYQSMTKDEGYLTHTIPVKKSSLVASKMITSLIIMAITVIAFIAIIFIAYGGNSMLNQSIDFIKIMITEIGGWITFQTMLTLIISYILQLAITFLAISMGGMHQQKLLFTFVYGFVIYTAMQIVMSVILVIAFLIVPDVFNGTGSLQGELSVTNIIFNISNIVSIILLVVSYIGSIKVLERRLNLE